MILLMVPCFLLGSYLTVKCLMSIENYLWVFSELLLSPVSLSWLFPVTKEPFLSRTTFILLLLEVFRTTKMVKILAINRLEIYI